MAKIQPIEFPILGTANDMIVRILPFEMDDTTATTYYELREVTDVTNEEGEVTGKTTKMITNGNYQLTEEEFAAWGQDNSYVVECVANHLGITIVSVTE
jgi:hypothetical protein